MYDEDLNVYAFHRVGDPSVTGKPKLKQKKRGVWLKALAGFFSVAGQAVGNAASSVGARVGQFLGKSVGKVVASEFKPVNLFHLAAGAILARGVVLGELLPFGVAYLAAVLVFRPKLAGLMVLSVVIGLWSTSIQTMGTLFWSQIAVILLIASLITSTKRKSEQWWIALPFLVLVVDLLVRNCFLVWAGWDLYQEISIIFEAVIAGVLSFIFMVSVQWIERSPKAKVLRPEELIAGMVLGICLILGINDIYIGAWALGPIAATLGVLFAAYLGGAGTGSAAGALIGLLPSVTHLIMPLAVGIYALAGLLAGVFRIWGRLGMTVGYVLGNLLLTLYLSQGGTGPESLIQLGIGVVIFLLIPNQFFDQLGTRVQFGRATGKPGFVGSIVSDPSSLANQAEEEEPEVQPADTGIVNFEQSEKLSGGKEASRGENGVADPIWWKLTNQRLKNLSGMLNELSATLEKEKGSPEKGADLLLACIENIRLEICQNCSAHRVCWEEDFYTTYRMLLDLLYQGETQNSNQLLNCEENVPQLKNRCLYPRELINYTDRICEKVKLQNYWQDRMEEGRDLVAYQVKGLAGVVNEVVAEFEKRVERDRKLENKIAREFKGLGVKAEKMQVYRLPSSELEIYFQIKDCPSKSMCQSRLLPALSRLLDQHLELRPAQCPSGRHPSCEICLKAAGRLALEVGISLRAEDGCNCSGDSYLAISLPGDRYLLALSDGMGVGAEASFTSQSTLGLLELVLGVGLKADQAVRAVNSMMLLRSDKESFATLDLSLIDLRTGSSELFKLGAPPTFVKHKGKASTISLGYPPVGILDALELSSLKYQFEPGDLIVMVTDGLLDSRFHVAERDVWLCEALEKINNDSPQMIADSLLAQAKANTNLVKDDMAILVARVYERDVPALKLH